MWTQTQSLGRRVGRRMVAVAALVALVSACGSAPPAPPPDPASLDTPAIAAALSGFQGGQIKQHMSVLADDANAWTPLR